MGCQMFTGIIIYILQLVHIIQEYMIGCTVFACGKSIFSSNTGADNVHSIKY